MLYILFCMFTDKKSWHRLMELLKDDGQDSEVLTYVMTLFNKVSIFKLIILVIVQCFRCFR